MMNLCITHKDKSQEIISGIVNAKHIPADGSDTYFQPGPLKYIDAFKPTSILLTLADGQQQVVSLEGVINHQYLSDEEIAEGYTFARPA